MHRRIAALAGGVILAAALAVTGTIAHAATVSWHAGGRAGRHTMDSR